MTVVPTRLLTDMLAAAESGSQRPAWACEQPPGYGPPTPVPILQWEAEFTALLALYRSRRPGRVLEIGTYTGGTLYHWLQNAAPGATIVTVDRYARDDGSCDYDHRADYPQWVPDGVTLHVIAGDSHHPDTIEQVYAHAPYDWVWIDGGHFYAEVKADWDTYRLMCRPGGLVCLHDINPAYEDPVTIEVHQLWAEIRAHYTTTEILARPASLPGADGGGIGIVHL